VKLNEEKELLKILADYKAKYTEFDKSMKMSRDTFKNYDKELKKMDIRIKDLEKIKKERINTLSKNKQ
jgi:hypothetical protein